MMKCMSAPPRTTNLRGVLTLFAACCLATVLCFAAAGCGEDSARTRAPTTFRIINSTGRSVFVQTGALWQFVRGPETLRANGTCGECLCDACDKCALCGRAIPTVDEIAPDAAVEFAWDGRLWPSIPNGCTSGISCQRPQAAAAGPIDLHVTYSFSRGEEAGTGGDVIGPPVTAKLTFSHPSATPVVMNLK